MKNTFFDFLRNYSFGVVCLILGVLFGLLWIFAGIWKALLVAALGFVGFFFGWCFDSGKTPVRVFCDFIERLKNE